MAATALNRLRYDPELPRLAAVMAMLCLAQLILAPQTHTHMGKTIDGAAVVLCTWDTDAVTVDDAPAKRTAALSFSALNAELLVGGQLPVSTHRFTSAALHHDAAPLPIDTPVIHHASIRAPPPV